MKTKILYILFVIAGVYACSDYPTDDHGLLISNKGYCYMSSFNLVGTDNQNVLVTVPTVANKLIDTVNCKVTAVAKFGTNLKKVKPYCGLEYEITCEPGMGSWDDFTTSKKYTLVSGNRKVRKEYTINITIQE